LEGDADWLLVPEPACDHDTTMDADEGAYEEVLIFSEGTTNLDGPEDERAPEGFYSLLPRYPTFIPKLNNYLACSLQPPVSCFSSTKPSSDNLIERPH